MAKGILYIMTTIVPGLIKIGICETKQYSERMRNLQSHGYRNVTGLKPFFAIEVENYKDKELLLKNNVYKNYRVGMNELFALDADMAKELLMAFADIFLFA